VGGGRTLIDEFEEGIVYSKEARHTEQGVHGLRDSQLTNPQKKVLAVVQQKDATLVQLLA
jgi:hypothetical protein